MMELGLKQSGSDGWGRWIVQALDGSWHSPTQIEKDLLIACEQDMHASTRFDSLAALCYEFKPTAPFFMLSMLDQTLYDFEGVL